MQKLKNKKLLSLFLAGMIATVSMGLQDIYAEDELDNNTDQEIVTQETKSIVVNDINNAENLNLKVKTQGTITKIDGSSIYIKDDSGEGVVFLENITVNEIKEGDTIEVTGTVVEQESKNVILIDNLNVISTSPDEDNNNPENEPDTPTTNPEEGNNNKPSDSDEASDSKVPSNKPSSSSGNNSSQGVLVQSANSSTEVIVSNNVAGKDPITISSDLTESQWTKVKDALEEGSIKVKDLPKNKIRITKVSTEKGDTIWIVNDPRKLDTEEEATNAVNNKSLIILESINYEEYDMTESKWNSISDDIIDGNAKIKVLDNQDLKIIYTKSEKEDSTTTFLKK